MYNYKMIVSYTVILVYVQLQNDCFIHCYTGICTITKWLFHTLLCSNDCFIHCYAHLKSFIWSDLLFLINIVLETVFLQDTFVRFVNGFVCIVVCVCVVVCVWVSIVVCASILCMHVYWGWEESCMKKALHYCKGQGCSETLLQWTSFLPCHVCVRLCSCVCMHACSCVCVCVCVCACISVFMCVCMHVCVCMHMCVYVCTCVCVCSQLCLSDKESLLKSFVTRAVDKTKSSSRYTIYCSRNLHHSLHLH